MKPTTSPGGRVGHVLACDTARGTVVLFGGSGSSGYLADTWTWDGTSWVPQLSVKVFPPARYAPAVAYDSVRQRIVLFGGQTANGYVSDTWEWDGKSWTKINTTQSPASRYTHSMAYDASRKGVLVFAGYSNRHENDTWLYQVPPSVAGAFTPLGKGCGPTPVMALAPDKGSRPILGKTFVLVASNLPRGTTSVLMSLGLSKKYLGTFPVLPLDLSPFGFTGCFLYHSFDAAWTIPAANGEGRFSAPAPNDPRLIGAKFYVQAAAGSVTSNAGEVLIGNQ